MCIDGYVKRLKRRKGKDTASKRKRKHKRMNKKKCIKKMPKKSEGQKSGKFSHKKSSKIVKNPKEGIHNLLVL